MFAAIQTFQTLVASVISLVLSKLDFLSLMMMRLMILAILLMISLTMMQRNSSYFISLKARYYTLRTCLVSQVTILPKWQMESIPVLFVMNIVPLDRKEEVILTVQRVSSKLILKHALVWLILLTRFCYIQNCKGSASMYISEISLTKCTQWIKEKERKPLRVSKMIFRKQYVHDVWYQRRSYLHSRLLLLLVPALAPAPVLIHCTNFNLILYIYSNTHTAKVSLRYL